MKDLPCLCDGRADIHCDDSHCELAGAGEPGNSEQCRVCWLRLKKVMSEEKTTSTRFAPGSPLLARSSPCVFLGEVVDKLGCACPAKWIRECAVHKVCNLEQCKSCPDYEAMQ